MDAQRRADSEIPPVAGETAGEASHGGARPKPGDRGYNRRVLLRRVALVGVPTVAVGALAWHWRIPQVATFLLSAGIGALFPQAPASPASKAAQWQTITPPASPAQLSTSRVALTYHPWYSGFDAASSARCLGELSALGAGYVRTDVRWSDVLPDGATIDESAFRWYQSFFRAARDWYGVAPLIVLSNPPDAVHKRSGDSAFLFDAWNRYVEAVVSRLGSLCSCFQVLNEPNNPVYQVFPSDQAAKAITEAASTIRAGVPNATIAVNVLVDLLGWRDAAESLLRDAGEAIDIVGLDHYPGTYTFSDAGDWSGINQLRVDVAPASAGSPWHGKSLAVMETGYATNVAWFRDGPAQADYYRQVGSVIAHLDALDPANPLALVGFYELLDMDSHQLLDPEGHFGLLTSGTLQRKPAFSVVRDLCHALGQP